MQQRRPRTFEELESYIRHEWDKPQSLKNPVAMRSSDIYGLFLIEEGMLQVVNMTASQLSEVLSSKLK